MQWYLESLESQKPLEPEKIEQYSGRSSAQKGQALTYFVSVVYREPLSGDAG